MSTNTSDWSGTRAATAREAFSWLQHLGVLRAPSVLWTAAALGVLTIVSRLPFVTTVPYAWDSVLYLRAMRDFDVAIAQPHPPGYIFYVMTAKLLARSVGGAHAGLVAESVLAASAAVVLTYLLGVRLVGRVGGLIAALLLAVSPPFWVYSGVAYPYTVLAACSVLLALVFSSRQLMRRWPAVGGLLLGAVGGYRTELTLFLAPLLALVTGWTSRWRPAQTVRAFAMVAAGGLLGIALWVLPSAAQSGGVVRYVQIVTAQTDYVEDSYSVFSHGWAAFSSNSGQVTRFLSESLGLAWLFAALWLLSPLLPWGRSPGRRARVLFVLCWITPLIVFHSLVHIGDRGYTFAYVPALCIAAGGGVVWTVRAGHRAWNAVWRTRLVTLGRAIWCRLDVSHTFQAASRRWRRFQASLSGFASEGTAKRSNRIEYARESMARWLARCLAVGQAGLGRGGPVARRWLGDAGVHAIVLGGLLAAVSASSFFFSVGRMTAADIRCFSPALQTAAAKIRAYLPADRTIIFSSFYLHQAEELLPGYRRWFFDPVGNPRYTWQVPDGVDYIAVFGDDLPVDLQSNSFTFALPCDRRLHYFAVRPGQELRYVPGESRVYVRRAADPLARRELR